MRNAHRHTEKLHQTTESNVSLRGDGSFEQIMLTNSIRMIDVAQTLSIINPDRVLELTEPTEGELSYPSLQSGNETTLTKIKILNLFLLSNLFTSSKWLRFSLRYFG